MTILERVQNYLGNGGFFNPEVMEHDKVRDLILDARAEIERLERERDDADQYIRAIWRADKLPSPLSSRLFDRLTAITSIPAVGVSAPRPYGAPNHDLLDGRD